jgi:hypothetical protein
LYNVNWTKGSDAAVGRLAGDGALVTRTYAEHRDLTVGERLLVHLKAIFRKTGVRSRHELLARFSGGKRSSPRDS